MDHATIIRPASPSAIDDDILERRLKGIVVRHKAFKKCSDASRALRLNLEADIQTLSGLDDVLACVSPMLRAKYHRTLLTARDCSTTYLQIIKASIVETRERRAQEEASRSLASTEIASQPEHGDISDRPTTSLQQAVLPRRRAAENARLRISDSSQVHPSVDNSTGDGDYFTDEHDAYDEIEVRTALQHTAPTATMGGTTQDTSTPSSSTFSTPTPDTNQRSPLRTRSTLPPASTTTTGTRVSRSNLSRKRKLTQLDMEIAENDEQVAEARSKLAVVEARGRTLRLKRVMDAQEVEEE